MNTSIPSVVTVLYIFFFFQAEDGIRDDLVTGVQTCALPICGVAHDHADARHRKIQLFGDDLRKPRGHAGEIGRASCRERGWISGAADPLKKKKRVRGGGLRL